MSFIDDNGNEYEPIVGAYEEDNRDDTILLDCPNCHITSSGTNWNKSIKNSIFMGTIHEYIPDNLSVDNWEEFAEDNNGTVDCPCCGEVCCLSDLEAVG